MSETVLLTGVSGFIAKRIARDLLEAGHRVRGSLRSPARAEEVRAALRLHLSDPATLDRLDFVTLDLTRDAGWAEAMAGVTALMHTASPFPLVQPRNEAEVIAPAVDGTLRALKAAQAAGVQRVVLTSSVAAVEANPKVGTARLTEADWSEVTHPRATAYYKSKLLAERAAWDFADSHPGLRLTTVNPGLVLGAPLDRHYGTSLGLIERILGGKDPMQPDIGFAIVDVADVSAVHLRALERPQSAGRRYLATAGSASMPQIARHLATRFPDRKIATRVAPKAVLRVLSLFDPSIRTVLPSLGSMPEFDTNRARTELGVTFAAWETAVDRAADAVLALKH